MNDGRGRHKNHKRGSEHYRWNDGRIKTSDSYILIRVGKDHPLADPNGYAPEHLIVWCSAGRQVPAGYVLHHIDRDRSNNRIYNLELMTRAEHNRLHNLRRGRRSNGTFKKAAGRELDGRTWDEFPEVKP